MNKSPSVLRLFLMSVSLAFAGSTPASAEATIATVSSGKVSTVIPFDFSNRGHILVSARIDRKGPFVFILDTDAERNVLDNSVVKVLGLRTRGKYRVQGFGPKKLDTTQTDEVTIQIGDASLAEQKFTALDFSGIKAVLGQTVQGLLGANIFKNFVIKIDYAHRTLSLSLPNTVTYQGDGVVMPLGFNNSHGPRIDGKIADIAGTFNLDTGAAGGLLLYNPFVEKNHLRERFRSQLQTTTDGGLGGETKIGMTPPMRLDFGGITVSLSVELALEKEGQTGVKDAAGTIGEAILSQMIVTFDYSHKRVIFEAPSQAAGAVPK